MSCQRFAPRSLMRSNSTQGPASSDQTATALRPRLVVAMLVLAAALVVAVAVLIGALMKR